MSALEQTHSRRVAGPLFAIGEWLMILPATILLAAAVLREMQPARFEPAHTSWIIFQWTVAHVSHFDAAVIFLALPASVALGGLVALLWGWSESESLRRDLGEAFGILRRNLATGAIATATFLGGAILAAVIVHLIIG